MLKKHARRHVLLEKSRKNLHFPFRLFQDNSKIWNERDHLMKEFPRSIQTSFLKYSIIRILCNTKGVLERSRDKLH